MNYIVAVSGGVDSVVLLDMLSKTQHKLIVAHVDHGIRGEESTADARFVAALARRYQLPFVSTELHLGAHASEETAREKRYEFLFGEAEKYRAVVVTALAGRVPPSTGVDVSSIPITPEHAPSRSAPPTAATRSPVMRSR